MAVTRINNNQITDASAGNAYVGVNAAVKLQNYTITSQKIANNLNYGSDLTISGNLTVNGTTTTVDTVNVLIKDPLITLADGQTTGTPTLDIGTIGLRGSQNSAVMAWKESQLEFVTALSNTTVSNTTFNISSYANLHTGNFIAQGTTSLVGNLLGAVNATATITGGNLATPGTVSSGGNITGANLLTGGLVSSTGTVTGGNLATGGTVTATGNITTSGFFVGTFAGSISGNVTAAGANTQVQYNNSGNLAASSAFTFNSATNLLSVTGNVQGGNLLTGGLISATSNITSSANISGGNVLTGGLVSSTGTITGGNLATGGTASATGNITGGNLNATTGVRAVTGYFTGNVDVLGNLNATVGVVYANSGIFYGNAVTGNNAAFAGVPGFTPLGSNVVMQFAGNVNSYSQLNFENINNGTEASTDFIATASNGDDTQNFIDLGIGSGTYAPVAYPAFGVNDGYVLNNGGNLLLNPQTAGKVIKLIVGGSANSNIVATVASTGITVTGLVSATGTVTGGNLATGGTASATGTITGGNLATGGTISATGNITGGNIAATNHTGTAVSVTGGVTAASVAGGVMTGTSLSVTGNVTGGNLVSAVHSNPTAMTISTAAGNINLNPAGNLVLNSDYINNVLDPVQPQDVATKAYVDNFATTGIAFHTPVVAATTTTLASATGGTITYTQPNGVANGVGALLTTTGSFNLIDTANVQTVGTRILVKNEGNAVYNGVYTWANATNIIRSTDADTYGPDSTTDLSVNDYFFVTAGNVNIASAYIVNSPTGTITFGTSNITFAQFSQAQSYTANTQAGLSLTGTIFSAKVDNNTTAFDGNGNIIVKASANLTTPNIGAATGTSVSVTGGVTAASVSGGVITGTSSSVSGAVTGGSIATGGTISATGNITGGNISATNHTGTNVSVTGTVTAASTVGGVITGTSASVSGGVTAASVAGGVITGTSSSVTGTQTAASTVGGVITGTSTSVSGGVTAASVSGGVITGTSSSVSGAVTGGSIATGGTISATGNITGGNISATNHTGTNVSVTGTVTAASTIGGVITGSSTSVTGAVTGATISGTGNITGGNILTGGLISAAGNIIANPSSFFIGNGSQLTGVAASSAGFPVSSGTTNISAATNGNIGFTIGGTSNVVTMATTGEYVTGVLSASGNVTGGNILTGGLVSATGTVQGGNIVLTGNSINEAAAGGTITINGSNANTNFAVNGDVNSNIFFINATTETASFGNSTQVTNAIVAFNASNSVLMPVGNSTQRPATGVTGMLRFNSTINSLELYDNSAWNAVGGTTFTVIADQQFNGDGTTVAFTLSSTQTTNSCIVSINGIVQIPTIAYSVAGTNPTCVLTFTEAPSAGDIIDVREITTTTSVTAISNSSGNAAVTASPTAPLVNVTGDLSVTGTILGGNINSTAITNGTSNVAVASSGGNVRFNIGGTSNVMVVSNGAVAITGDLSVSGNATLSGNILGDRIQNGTTSFDIQTPSGNANITVGSASNVAVFSPTIVTMAANMVPSANITYDLGTTTQRWKDLWLSNSTIYMGNAQISANATSLIFTNPQGGQTVLAGATSSLTGASLSVTGSVTAASVVGGVITGSSTSVTGTVTAASTVGGVITGSSLSVSGTVTGTAHNGTSVSVSGGVTAASVAGGVITGSSVSVTGNVTGGNVNTGGIVSSTGNIYMGTAANLQIGMFNSNIHIQHNTASGNITLLTNFGGAGVVEVFKVLGQGSQGIFANGTASVSGNIIGGNVNTTSVSASGTVTAASTVGGVITGSTASLSGSITGSGITASSVAGGVITGSSASVTGAVTAASTVGGVITGSSVSVSGGVTAVSVVGGVITGSSTSVSGTTTAANFTTAGVLTVNSGAAATAIVNGATTGVGNIGSSTTTFNTVFAKATTAQYADLAEKYTADASYAPGTVLVFGGNQEVTVNAVDSDHRVAGVVSTNPGFVMNEGLDSEFAVAIALTGRVPCFVIGPVKKGDLMVAAGLGRARAEANPKPGTIIGKALEDFGGTEGTIEVVVGRF